jgi:hypothetical protein
MRAGMVKIEPAWLDAVFAQHLAERSVVDEEALGETAGRSVFGAAAISPASLLLPTRHPIWGPRG